MFTEERSISYFLRLEKTLRCDKGRDREILRLYVCLEPSERVFATCFLTRSLGNGEEKKFLSPIMAWKEQNDFQLLK